MEEIIIQMGRNLVDLAASKTERGVGWVGGRERPSASPAFPPPNMDHIVMRL